MINITPAYNYSKTNSNFLLTIFCDRLSKKSYAMTVFICRIHSKFDSTNSKLTLICKFLKRY